MPALSFTLFINPIQIGDWWYWLLVPLSAGIAVVYKALKVRHVRQVPLSAAVLTVTILAGMAAAAAFLFGIDFVFGHWLG